MHQSAHARGYSYPRTWVAMTTYVGMRDQNDGYPYPKPWAAMPKGLGKSGQKHILKLLLRQLTKKKNMNL